MSKLNRMRCPHCGTCYEVEDVTEKDTISCQVCGNTTKLCEEDPEGVISGSLPPLRQILAISGTILLCLLAAWISSFFAILAFGAMIYHIIDIFQSYKKQRAERIDQWNRHKDTHTKLTCEIKELSNELYKTKEREGELSSLYERISPEKRDNLATQIEEQQKTLGIICEIKPLLTKKSELESDIMTLKNKIISFEEEVLFQSFGFYKPLYDCADSESYRQLLEKIRTGQKEMIKNKTALREDEQFSIIDDKSVYKKLSKNLEKLILRAFNGECDATIDKVSFSNIDAIRSRINKCFHDLNDLASIVGISITQSYLNTKLEELQLCYEYQIKRKEEKEEQRKIRDQMREEARVIKEIEEAKKTVEKEEKHFCQIIDEIRTRMEAASAFEKEQYEKKLREYEEQLAVVKKDKEEIEFREKSTRAGYVYIISNIGSFGENVYKIGVTRRLEPQERIEELGDASVPFEFDVHAMIFSHDAPSLESALHDHFADRAINKVNPRKEFFRVDINEIENIVHTHHNVVVEFTKMAKAEEYRLSIAEQKKNNLASS